MSIATETEITILLQNYDSIAALVKLYPAVMGAEIKTLNGDIYLSSEEGCLVIQNIKTMIAFESFIDDLKNNEKTFDDLVISLTMFDFYGRILQMGAQNTDTNIDPTDLDNIRQNLWC